MQDDPERSTFTDFLRLLGTAGEPLEAPIFDRVWESLRAALAAELRRRSLWGSPPSYLGVYGAERWGTGRASERPDPLDDLTAECYAFVFIDRLRALLAQLEFRENVDGLVFLNIRHFLYERQKDHDPLGFQVFDAVRTAVRRAVEAGELEVLKGDPRVRNETVLGFRPGAEPTEAAEVDLPGLVREWNDELLPDLVTAHGRGRQPVLGSLRRRLKDLRKKGIEAIRFKDLIDPLKEDVRARWASLVEQEAREVEGDETGRWLAGAASRLRPDHRFEARDTFRALVRCVSERLDRSEGGEPGRHYLETLWSFLRTWAAGPGEEGTLPSRRKLAELLGIPRDRLPGLYGTLQELVEECEGEISGAARRPEGRADEPLRPGDERRPG